jgi:hypothetical protein
MRLRRAVPIAPVPVRWPLSSLAETVTSDHASAACYRLIEHVGIETVVVAELKFRDVKRHIFRRHFVERPDHATLEDRPEALNRVRVNRADNVLLFVMLHGLARIFDQPVVNLIVVSCQQANLVGNDLSHKRHGVLGVDVIENAGDHVALALDCANDRRLAGRLRAGLAVVPLVPMAILVLAADVGFVDLDNAAQLHRRINQRRADFVAHGMGRLVAAETHHALDLECAHSLLAGEHEMGDPKPVPEGLFGVLENRPAEAREPIALLCTGPALPVEGLVAGGVVQLDIPATRTGNALRPAAGDQVAKTGFVVPDWETGLELGRRHLRDWFRAPWHCISPWGSSVKGYCHG